MPKTGDALLDTLFEDRRQQLEQAFAEGCDRLRRDVARLRQLGIADQQILKTWRGMQSASALQ